MELLSRSTATQSPASVANTAEASTIAGISEPTIARYFETLNAGDFEATGRLFADDGALHPPFENAIIGPAAIMAYLQTEAKGFKLQPMQGVTQPAANGCTDVQVNGKVQTPLFAVNVSWLFVLTSDQKLQCAKIKLLASPQELLTLKR